MITDCLRDMSSGTGSELLLPNPLLKGALLEIGQLRRGDFSFTWKIVTYFRSLRAHVIYLLGATSTVPGSAELDKISSLNSSETHRRLCF